MAQITRTTNELIINSLYLIGELGVGEIPDSFMLSSGLELINELINKFSADSIYVPFLTTLSFTMVQGQATYSIGNSSSFDINADRIVDLVFANYLVQTIEYPIKIINKATYYGVVRLASPTLQSRPGFCFLDKQDTESFVTFYPAPDQPYPCTLKAKVMVDKLTEHELMLELPPFYYGFMKYALARKFLSYYPSGNWPASAEEEYQDYFNIVKNANETDLTIRPSVIMDAPQPFYWPNILAY
jgi:hypothetical protein